MARLAAAEAAAAAKAAADAAKAAETTERAPGPGPRGGAVGLSTVMDRMGTVVLAVKGLFDGYCEGGQGLMPRYRPSLFIHISSSGCAVEINYSRPPLPAMYLPSFTPPPLHFSTSHGAVPAPRSCCWTSACAVATPYWPRAAATAP